jgi:hypothetical protein
LAARSGNCILFLARQMSCSAACLAPRREKRSEQTIYHAATRVVLQIDFPAREIDFGWRTVIARKSDSTRKTKFTREGKDDGGFLRAPADAHAGQIIFGGIAPKCRSKPKEILVPLVPPSCQKRSLFSPVAPKFTIEQASQVPVSRVRYL